MHLKFLSHGKGKASKGTAYVLSEKDHHGNIRAGVTVLRGNPQRVADVADSLTFTHKYTSGVIAWHSEDKPTPEQIEQTLNEFERLAFANLDPERYCWTAVQHIEDDGSTHIHILIARVDLLTGKSLNVAPPGWQKDFDPLRDWLNHSHSWARPDDPARARLVQPGHEALKTAATIRAGLTAKTAKDEITGWLTERIIAGAITDRQGIINSLSELGEITRAGADYVSVKPQGFEKAVRLKGAIYAEGFKREQLVSSNPRESESRQGAGREIDSRAVADAQRELEAAISRRSDYNAKRYRRSGTPVKPDSETPQRQPDSDQQRAGEPDKTASETVDAADSPPLSADVVPLPDRLWRQLAMVQAQQSNGDSDSLKRQAMGGDAGNRLDFVPEPDASKTLPPFRFLQQLKEAYDRTRNTTAESIDRVISRIRSAFGRLGKASADLEQQAGETEHLFERINDCTRKLNESSGSGGLDLAGHVTAPPINDEPSPPGPSLR